MTKEMSNKVKLKNKPTNKVKVYTKKKKGAKSEPIVIQKLIEKYNEIDTSKINTFSDLPLSPKTLKGLEEHGYTNPTEIQKESIALGLQGKDILGAAQTGSGKTLAFLIPILEKLFCLQWTKLDGIGALVITPTRELALQIFETLQKISKYHEFSQSLIIGGKDLKFEMQQMNPCNIIICTPGRLLQHMDENVLFDCVNVKILVLDEADRCLDMGFEKTMNAIIDNLPPVRQTLLFSATQTKSVRDLVRLSLKDPSYVAVHEHAKHSTPPGLQQSYTVCNLENKIAVIWSFIKKHSNKKSIIFLSTCKQVKYIYEIFCKLRPGLPVLALYGTLHQLRRMDIYKSFCEKQRAVLFATDLVARGLDFPAVDWVVQADCPEDCATYIHRVGRTARYNRGGESLLLLLPTEVSIVDDLIERKIPLEKIEINPDQLHNPIKKIENFLVSTPALKDDAQRAFVAYMKSVVLMKNKNIFKMQELNRDSFAQSLGLVVTPRLRFLDRHRAMQSKKDSLTDQNQNKQNKVIKFNDFEEDAFQEKPDISKEHKFKELDSDDGDDDILKIKRVDHDIDSPTENELSELQLGRSKKKKPLTKAAMARKMLKKKALPNKKIVFDDSGEVVVQATKEKQSALALEYENENVGGIDLEKARMVLQEEDKFDKELFKEKVKVKKKEMKKKLKKKKLAEEEEGKDDFGSDSEYEPDLSWMPDPDKIYRAKNEDDDEREHENWREERGTSDDDEDEDLIKKADEEKITKKSKKRKLDPPAEKPNKIKKKIENLGDSLTVNEAEELALMLLNKK